MGAEASTIVRAEAADCGAVDERVGDVRGGVHYNFYFGVLHPVLHTLYQDY
jgi:hypothetical protein